jgi:hypothetical protein
MLELDSEPDSEYGMAYDAVYAYVDEGPSTRFSKAFQQTEKL